MMILTRAVFTLVFLIWGVFGARSETAPDPAPTESPSLISSIRIQRDLQFCGEPVSLKDQEMRERLEKELLLTLADRPQVILWLKRANRYMPTIVKMLRSHNMPEDLKYVAVIESALRPHVRSPAGAVGFWQFMKETGLNYGLAIDDHLDERRNIFKSTRASIRYFKTLYEKFGSWTLAAAAYNMGEEGLRAEIALQNVNNYYRLYLPLETQRYMFRIFAAKIIITEPETYGFRLTASDQYPPLKFDRVTFRCTRRVPIHVIAQAAGTYFKIVKDLNPEIRGYFFPQGEHAILVPKGAAIDFQARYDKALDGWLSQNSEYTHVVQSGDNLSSIAERFGVPLPSLLIWNRLDPRKPIHPGDRLMIYLPENENDAAARPH